MDCNNWCRMHECVVHQGINTVARKPSWCRSNSEYHKPHSQLREQVSNVRMIVSALWRGPRNIHGFILDGKSYRQGSATVQTPTATAVSAVDFTHVQPHYYYVR